MGGLHGAPLHRHHLTSAVRMGHDRTTKGPRPATPDPPPAASLLRLDISQALVYDRGASFLTACRRADQLRPSPARHLSLPGSPRLAWANAPTQIRSDEKLGFRALIAKFPQHTGRNAQKLR